MKESLYFWIIFKIMWMQLFACQRSSIACLHIGFKMNLYIRGIKIKIEITVYLLGWADVGGTIIPSFRKPELS